MATSAANIFVGAGNIFLGKTGTGVLPTSGTPPTIFAHTAGVPSGAQTGYTHIGHTEGDATFTYKATKTEITSEQNLAPVDVFVVTEECSLVFTAQEQVYVGLQAAFDGIGTVTDGSKNLFYGGNGDLSAPSTWAVWLSSRRRDSSAKYEGLCIYKAYSVDGIQLKYSRVNKTTYQITLKGLAVETRNAGDQLFQFYREA